MPPVPPVRRPSVIVDCDPGHDDMAALAMAAAHCDVLGVTTVAGNAPLDACTRNALVAVELFGLDVDVRAGADRPLVRSPGHQSAVHGEDGLSGVTMPPAARAPADGSAVEWILEVTRAVADVWLVATGPLTNLAVALRADPGLASRLAGISLMGGGIAVGNVRPVAEFNFWFDPEAAAMVITSGVPIRMCGLDVTQQVLIDEGVARDLRTGGGGGADFLADVFAAYARACEPVRGVAAGPLHDPCAVAALSHPHLFRFEHVHVQVETADGPTRGMSVADRRTIPRGRRGQPNALVAMDVDGEAMRDLVVEAVARCG